MAASSSALQVSGGHSSVASRSHINRKKWCVLAALHILQKWPLCGKLKYKATQICYTCFLLAQKVTAQCTLVGQVCTSPLLNYRRAAKDVHLLLRTEPGLKKKKNKIKRKEKKSKPLSHIGFQSHSAEWDSCKTICIKDLITSDNTVNSMALPPIDSKGKPVLGWVA